MSRPVIGVTTSKGRGWRLWAFAALSLRLHGAQPVRLTAPFVAEQFSGLDGLVIGGGDDIGATLYDAMPAPNVRIDPDRDAMEQNALSHLWETDTPILGICRGAQMLNVFRGGRLHADIYDVYQSAPRMRTPLPRKRVDLVDGSRVRRIVEEDCIIVNALHHQSVDTLGDGLQIAGLDEHGIVQAIEFAGEQFRIGVQWHPEFLFYRKAHRRLFRALVSATIAVKAGQAIGDAKPAPI